MNEELKESMRPSDVTGNGGELTQEKLPITVKWGTLVEGLGILFTGVAKLLESIDPHVIHKVASIAAAERENMDRQKALENVVPEQKNDSIVQTTLEEHKEPSQKEANDSTDSQRQGKITTEDIIRIIVSKVK